MRAGVPASIRKLSRATGIPKSSVDRHCKALQKQAESAAGTLWEQEVGQDALHRLVLAVVFVFGIKAGVGADRLSEFFHRVHLDRHIGCSATTLRRLRGELETLIVSYAREQEAQCQSRAEGIEICAGVDETFFEQVILVMMDLESGYLVLEDTAEDRRYATWYERAQPALARLGLTVRYLVSARAQALVKLALEGFSCPSVPDVFHCLRDLTKVVGGCFHLKLARVEEKQVQAQHRLETLQAKGKATAVEQRLLAHLSNEAAMLHTDQTRSQTLLRQATTTLHPFTLAESRRQSAARVETVLGQTVAELNQLRRRYTQRDNTQAVAKFSRQIPALASVIDLWWQGVEHSLTAVPLDTETQYWLVARVLPAYYWQQQVAKTKTPVLKAAYQQAFDQATDALAHHPLSTTLAPGILERWQHWACEWAGKFQRASSAVEGRNGYLSQLNHCARGTSTQRLPVMTVIHNVDLKRADGTTAAERLFGSAPPDLLDWVVARMGPLPMPRKARPRAKPKPLILQTCPALRG